MHLSQFPIVQVDALTHAMRRPYARTQPQFGGESCGSIHLMRQDRSNGNRKRDGSEEKKDEKQRGGGACNKSGQVLRVALYKFI